MKLSLIELTQDILSSLDSDEVGSINDTTESLQVSKIIRSAYFNIIARANLPKHHNIFSLVVAGDSTQPVLMRRPDNVSRIDWVKYEKSIVADPDSFSYVTILPLQQFTDMMHQLNVDETTVDFLDFPVSGINFYFRNDKQPDFCTIVDNYYVVFDSWNKVVDVTTLDATKTLCFGLTIPTFTMSDSFIPDIDENQFPLLLNEAKSLAFLELKQVANDHAIRESKRQWNSLQKNKELSRASSFDQLPYFGRK